MQAAAAKPIIDQLRGAGLTLTVKPDGKLTVSPSTSLTDELRALIRDHKPAIVAALTTPAANDAQPGTQRPDDLPPKLLAASQALDARIVAAGLSLTPPEQPKPKLAASNAAVPPVTQAKAVKHVDQSWKPLALAYHAHLFKCHVCTAAGQGRGLQCGVGAALKRKYEDLHG